MRRVAASVLILLMASPASAQVVPGAFTTVTTTSTGARSLMVGCAVTSASQCTGGISAGPISVSTVTGSGLLTMSALGEHVLGSSGTGTVFLTVKNTTLGTANYAGVQVVSGTTGGGLYAFNSSYTSSGTSFADGMTLTNAGEGGISISAVGSAADIRFYTGAFVLAGTITDAGLLSWVGAGTFGSTLTERGRSVPIGDWAARSYAASYFTGNDAMTWVVQSGDYTLFRYGLIGTTMTIRLDVTTSTVAGTPSTALQFSLPESKTCTSTGPVGTFWYSDNGTEGTGIAVCTATGTVVQLFKEDPATSWSAATNATAIRGVFVIEVS